MAESWPIRANIGSLKFSEFDFVFFVLTWGRWCSNLTNIIKHIHMSVPCPLECVMYPIQKVGAKKFICPNLENEAIKQCPHQNSYTSFDSYYDDLHDYYSAFDYSTAVASLTCFKGHASKVMPQHDGLHDLNSIRELFTIWLSRIQCKLGHRSLLTSQWPESPILKRFQKMCVQKKCHHSQNVKFINIHIRFTNRGQCLQPVEFRCYNLHEKRTNQYCH